MPVYIKVKSYDNHLQWIRQVNQKASCKR